MESSSIPPELKEAQEGNNTFMVNNDQNNQRYASVFPVEIECWCFGISNFPGQLYPKLIHRVIKEMSPTFRAAIDNGYVFDIFDTAKKIFQSSAGIIPEKQIVFSILANLPLAFELEEESLFVLAQVIDQVEKVYGGVIDQMEELWRRERLKKKSN